MDNLEKYFTDRTNLFYSDGGEVKHYVPAGVALIEWTNLIHIYGGLPECAKLLNFKNGETIEILDTFGRRDFYHSEDVIFRFKNCRIERMWIVNPVCCSSDLTGLLTLRLHIHADIEYLGKKPK